MKNKILLFFVLFFMASCSAKTYYPLNQQWSYPLKSDEIYTVDLDRDGLLELCVVSHEERRSCIYFFNYEGKNLGLDCLSGYGKPQYPHAKEELSLMYIVDMNNDEVLDVLAASAIIGTGVNVKKMYVVQREYVSGLNRYEYDLKWEYTAGNTITDIKTTDVNGDGWDEIIMSSLDSNVYVFGQNRKLKYSYPIGGGVWSIAALDMDGDGGVEIAVGSLSGVSLIKDGGVLWNYSTGERIFDVYASDLNKDNCSEILALSGSWVYLLDFNGTLLWRRQIDSLVDSWIKDVDNDGNADVLLLTEGSMHSLDSKGNIQWTHVFNEPPLSLNIDFYNNIFVGTLDNLYHFVVDQDYLLNEKAEESYSKAYRLYLEDDYIEARFYAARAKLMFEMVDNREGVLRCEFIFLVTDVNSTSLDKRVKADDYYDKAVELLDVNSFEDARYYAEMALDIYLEINDKNSAIKCDLFLSDIDKKKKELEKSNALKNYNSAVVYLSNNRFDVASQRAREALALYTELNDSKGIADSLSLLDRIALTEKIYNADSFYNLSLQSFNSQEYENASFYADKARDLYLELGNTESSAECEYLLNLAERYIEAESYYDLAVEQHRSAYLENATLYVQRAKAIYEELNDSKGIDNCIFLLSEIEESKKNVFFSYGILAAPVLFFVILIILLHLRRRSSGWN